MNEPTFCRIAQCEIPGVLCLELQNETDCRGCRASTRRCTYCYRLDGIENATEGFCRKCTEDSKRSQVPTLGEATNPEAVLAHVEHCSATVKPETVAQHADRLTRWAAGEEVLGFDSVLLETVKLRDVLLEHTWERGGLRRVNAVPILRVRVRLTDPEIQVAMEELVRTGWFSYSKTKGELIVLYEPAPETLRVEDAQPDTEDGPRRRKPSKAREQKIFTPIPMLCELARVLAGRARLYRGQRMVSGIVPWLCATYSVTEREAIQGLEALAQFGILETRDGWRSIIVLEGTISSDAPAFRSNKKRPRLLMPR